MKIQVGELFRFGWWTGSRDLRGREGLYMGEDFIHRSDGVVVENHRVLMIGDSTETIIDRGLLKHMNPIEQTHPILKNASKEVSNGI